MTDRDGKFLAIGDRVYVECEITAVLEQRDVINLQLKPLIPMRRDTEPIHYINLSGEQVTKLVKAAP